MSRHSRPVPARWAPAVRIGTRLLYAAHFGLGITALACLALAVGAGDYWMLLRGGICLGVAVAARWALHRLPDWAGCEAEGELAEAAVSSPYD